MTDDNKTTSTATPQSPNRRRRNLAILIILVAWAMLIYGITILKIIGPNAGG